MTVPPRRTLDDALAIMRDLRARDAWDKAQTHESLRPYLNEEAHELDDALRDRNGVVPRQALAVRVSRECGGGPSAGAESVPPLAHRQFRVPVRVEPCVEFVEEMMYGQHRQGVSR